MNEIGRRITDKIIEIHGSTDFSIAFLPYKRSMWNSMASVYEECKASGIEAHCYPIPYLRMKENRQPDYLDCDRELFGDIAEPISELKRADYIAIHYQYENKNKVTNMLPEFFTKALKDRYGARIIYLPYGIGSGEGAFSLHPGCRYVDYAFLEDDICAERFIAAWMTQGVDFSGRCFGFGSAKLDAARAIVKTIPPEWTGIIGGKPVTLIINSLGPFLEDPVGHLVSYNSYIIRELSRDRAVIFRPHPLLRTTIRSMVPGVLEYYEGFIRTIREQVIVDESEYLERAMAASDYLIADRSSVVAMWRETGKGHEIIGG